VCENSARNQNLVGGCRPPVLRQSPLDSRNRGSFPHFLRLPKISHLLSLMNRSQAFPIEPVLDFSRLSCLEVITFPKNTTRRQYQQLRILSSPLLETRHYRCKPAANLLKTRVPRAPLKERPAGPDVCAFQQRVHAGVCACGERTCPFENVASGDHFLVVLVATVSASY